MGTKGFPASKFKTVDRKSVLKQHENANICHSQITCQTVLLLLVIVGLVSVSSTNLPIMQFTGNQTKQIVEDNSYMHREFWQDIEDNS